MLRHPGGSRYERRGRSRQTSRRRRCTSVVEERQRRHVDHAAVSRRAPSARRILTSTLCLAALFSGVEPPSLYARKAGAEAEGRRVEIPSGSHLDAVAAAALAANDDSRAEPEPTVRASNGASRLRFVDIAEAAGIDFRYTFGDYAYDNILESSGSGVTWLDHDRDGDLDLYLLNGVYLDGISDPKGAKRLASAVNRLYCNDGAGTFQDCTERSGLGDSVWSMAAAVGDVDDDGYPDLFVANYGPNRLYRNNGDGTFTNRADELGLQGPRTLNGQTKWSVGGSWFDADGDGALDLAVCNFLAFDPLLLVPNREWEMPEPKEYAGQPSQLYLQRPRGRFHDVTEAAGLWRPSSKCMGITVIDLDQDRRPEILQTNDHQPNFLFIGDPENGFEDVGTEAGIAVNDQGLGTGSMHATPGDVDGDGLIDLLVVDLRHGSLYTRSGPTLFKDSTWASGVGSLLDGLGQWGAGLADFDLDGDLDLFTTNGVAHILVEQYPMLALNDGSGRFVDARAGAGSYFQGRRSGRGAALADFDNDGDLDIAVNHVDHRATASLLRNDSEQRGEWLMLELVGDAPRSAHGAAVRALVGDRELVRVHQPAASYLSGNDPRVHLGTGDRDLERLDILWPSGKTQRLVALPTNRRYVILEAANRARARH